MKHRSLFLLAVLALLTPVATSLAQSAPVSPNTLPQMYISGITFEKEAYAVGETVKGHLILHNYSDNNTGDIRCLVSLVGTDKDDHVASVVYDRKQSPLIDIAAKSQKDVNFTYPIAFAPASDHLAIHIRAVMRDGGSLAWALKPIKITGGITMAEPVDGFVLVNDKQKYGLQEGPTLTDKDAASFNLKLKNPGTVDMDLTPRAVITNKSGEAVKDAPAITVAPLNIKAGQTSDLKIDLPVKGIKPDTYLVKLDLVDASGAMRAPYFYARYIVGGDIVNVTQVLSGAPLPIKKYGAVALSLEYTGKPLDISIPTREAFEKSTPVVADVKMELFNEKHEQVGSLTATGLNFDLVGKIPLMAVVQKPSKVLLAQVEILQGDKVLSAYKGKVIYDAANAPKKISVPVELVTTPTPPATPAVAAPATATVATGGFPMWGWLVVAGMVLIGLVLAFLPRKK